MGKKLSPERIAEMQENLLKAREAKKGQREETRKVRHRRAKSRKRRAIATKRATNKFLVRESVGKATSNQTVNH